MDIDGSELEELVALVVKLSMSFRNLQNNGTKPYFKSNTKFLMFRCLFVGWTDFDEVESFFTRYHANEAAFYTGMQKFSFVLNHAVLNGEVFSTTQHI